MRLLIIDDEPHIRQMMRLTLEAVGYEIDEAAAGEEGLARFRDGRDYVAVLLDQKMPGLDGLETLRRLRAREAGACVLIVTAFGSIELAVDAMRLGASDFLRKPMTPETLRGAVAAAVSRGSAEQQRRPATVREGPPPIQTVTLNGFEILGVAGQPDPASPDHTFRVKHFPDGAEATIVITIDPDVIARVDRLSQRHLPPGGRFWRSQAERLLSAYVWSEGKAPGPAELCVRDVSRDDIERVAAGLFD